MTDFEKAQRLNEWQEANCPLGVIEKYRLTKLPDGQFEAELDRLASEYWEEKQMTKQEVLDFLTEQRELRLVGYDKTETESDFDRWQLAQAEMYQKVIDWIDKEVGDE